MTSPTFGVCSWAIDRHDPLSAIEVAGRISGLSAIQIGLFSEAAVSEADPEAIGRAACDAGLRVTSSFVAFDGEDYGSIQRIAATGGYACDEAYERRSHLTREVADLTRRMGADAVAVHVGTIPRDPGDALFATLVARCTEVAEMFKPKGEKLVEVNEKAFDLGREAAMKAIG